MLLSEFLDKIYTYQISNIPFQTNVYLPELKEVNINPLGAIWVVDSLPKFSEFPIIEDTFYNEKEEVYYQKSIQLGEILLLKKRELFFVPNFDKGEDYLRMVVLGSISMIFVNCFELMSFHAASVVVNDKAILFCGASGRGKSSIAAYFNTCGYHVLADDVTNCGWNESGELVAFSSVPRIKLSEGVLAGMGIEKEGLLTIPSVNLKYSLPIENATHEKGYPIQLIVYPKFESNSEDKIVKISGIEKYKYLMQNIYRKKLAKKNPYIQHRYKIIFDLSTHVPMCEFVRSDNNDLKSSSMKFIENYLNEYS